jgi:hypothetical protein
VLKELLDRARAEVGHPEGEEKATRGTMISRFSFSIDVNEWGFRDLRKESVREMRESATVREIMDADVFDERGEGVDDPEALAAE